MTLSLFSVTSRITSLARSGRISCARKLFDDIPTRDTVAWNAMITAYSQLGLHGESLSLFGCMRTTGLRPDHFTLTAALTACAGLRELLHGAKVHALVYVLGYQHHTAVNNTLINTYGKCLNPTDAGKVFEEMGIRNEVSWCSLLFAYVNCNQMDTAGEVFNMMPGCVTVAWNIMIAGYARFGEIEMCLGLFKEMRTCSCEPDQFTLSCLMGSFSQSSDLLYGSMVHGCIVKSGWESAAESRNSIITFYAKLYPESVLHMLESFETLSTVSQNAIIDSHMKSGDTGKALLAFKRVPNKNIISWTIMISGLARNGSGEQALTYFADMVRNSICPDDLSLGAVLHACSSLAVLGHGKMLHGCVITFGFQAYVYVGNGLMNMYAKCGDLEASRSAFDELSRKDIVSWNSLLFGFGMHGEADKAFQLVEEMVACGAKPDKVTFIGLLMTCSHLGLLEKGQDFLKSMETEYGLKCESDHLSCIVDMLARGRHLLEAEELVQNCGSSTLEVLLGACSGREDTQIGMISGEKLKSLEPTNDMGYVMLSNLYCVSGKWEEAEMVRKTMVTNGVKKVAGCSWVEINNSVTAFLAGNNSHPKIGEIYEMLSVLDFNMQHP